MTAEWRRVTPPTSIDLLLDDAPWPVLVDTTAPSWGRRARHRAQPEDTMKGTAMNDKTRRTIRTTLQIVLMLAVSVPVIVDATGLTPEDAPWLAGVVAVGAVIARVMQSDIVERLLQRYLGGVLAASPPSPAVEGEASWVDEHDGSDA